MPQIQIVPTTLTGEITITADLEHRCPFKPDDDDSGTVTIRMFLHDGQTVELHSLAEYLRGFYDWKISHEDLTARIYADLYALRESIEIIEVATRWDTAGMGVEVKMGTA
jgi:NADPH-dependent 7-cyano-7-deazaguanine reductase QueF